MTASLTRRQPCAANPPLAQAAELSTRTGTSVPLFLLLRQLCPPAPAVRSTLYAWQCTRKFKIAVSCKHWMHIGSRLLRSERPVPSPA